MKRCQLAYSNKNEELSYLMFYYVIRFLILHYYFQKRM